MSDQKVIEQLKDDPLMPLRHTAEHVLHTAMKELYPNIKLVMGPPIEDGYYFDFDLDESISQEDFPKIEAKMQEIIDKDLKMQVEEVSLKEVREIFKDNPYKQDTLDEIEKRGEKSTICIMGDKDNPRDVDLCVGYHTKKTGDIKAFKLLNVAGAYYKGDEKNKMLQRIYGTAFDSQKKLEEYLENLKEAKERDHRRIGKDLELFVFSDTVGKGLPLLTAKGNTIKRELEKFIVEEELKRGYQHVKTPDLAKVELYEKSGHYPYYKDSMYPVMEAEDEKLILRPMTCPHHFELYSSRPRSYRELPMRIAEIAHQYRYEKSGELTGLIRVRMFTLADAHIICTKQQAENEIEQVLDLIEYVSDVLGLIKGEDYLYRLSKGDRQDKEKYYKDDKAWDFAEDVLRKVLKKRKSPFYEADDEAAFYGPKIDIQMKNVLGKEDTAFTVQYDFVMPKRFELTYIDKDGEEKEPIVIHRSSIGCLERVMAFLIEHYKGEFPVWLAPQQIEVIPISDDHLDYAFQVKEMFKKEGLRVEVNEKDATMAAKIREAQQQKIPYMFIVGDKEIADKTISVRLRTGEQHQGLEPGKVLDKIKDIYLTRSLKLW
jgi:threonyl-tRNA synthetase